jgi:hypothetical protein
MLQNLKPFTCVNANPAARSLHSSHLGVTCQLFLPLQSSALPLDAPTIHPGAQSNRSHPCFGLAGYGSMLTLILMARSYGRLELFTNITALIVSLECHNE